ncbi:MAG TPA: plastocyanin/azurin family copper-binding protein [Actinomycetota bacterium]|nr:plastocyanin/azurin family copper-binding protein [Actinomycetota bacterium]
MGRLILATAVLTAFVASSGQPAPGEKKAAAPAERASKAPAEQARAEPPAKPERVDPREGGFEIVLGEWAVTPEAPAIRPGRVTFVVHTRGTMGHGYEMELEGDSSGPGSGDLFKAESEVVRPGESTRMTVTLPPGLYEIECLVDGHDDMGMEGVLEVRAGAPLVAVEEPARPDRIAIRDFAFDPPVATVAAGTEVTWRNSDPADHTVTNLDGVFGSETLPDGGTFSHRFTEPGVYEYQCAIHPEMKGKVKVE